ncbi:MAG: aldehyde dehydrogenase family protein [Cohaesibacteraceae bacterium]|nr:aldehyde dehydrogenase family protein [Cohaesibacteraceae bacterium]
MQTMDHFQLLIDGQWCDGAEAQVMETLNPATGAPWATFACAAPADVDRAVTAAARVLDDPAWRDMTQRPCLLYARISPNLLARLISPSKTTTRPGVNIPEPYNQVLPLTTV